MKSDGGCDCFRSEGTNGEMDFVNEQDIRVLNYTVWVTRTACKRYKVEVQDAYLA